MKNEAAPDAMRVLYRIALLPERTRRVGTPWPTAVSREDCGIGKAARKIRRGTAPCLYAALHNSLILLEDGAVTRTLFPFTAVTPQFIPRMAAGG
jgi:hypothetical protein